MFSEIKGGISMKRTKRNAAIIFTVLLIAATIGCASAQKTGKKKTLNIGVVQIVAHKALDASREGFVQALADNGFHDGEEVKLDFHDAAGDMSNMASICDRFVNDNVDLVLAITTPAAQTMAAKSETIPIVATAVTSFEGADLVDSDESPGRNVTGTSDMNPVEEQIGLIKELFPDAQTVGFLYNSSESNSILQIDIAKKAAENLGLKHIEVTITNTGEALQAAQSLVAGCDVIYLPTDNTVSSAMATIGAVAAEAGIPTICGEENQVLEGGLVTMGVNYFDIGYMAGLMAIEIFNGANPAEMPIQFAAKSETVVINGFISAEIGFTVPEEFQKFVVFPEE